MPAAGHRHRLVLYTYMLNRWWRATLGIGVLVLLLAAGLGGLPLVLPQYNFLWVPDQVLWTVGGAGAFAVFLSIFLASIRKSAYVQPFSTHLRLVTPFLRMNISYRRIVRTYNAEFGRLFPPGRFKGRKRAILLPIARSSIVVLELNGWPLARGALGLFLSPFFFPDKSPRLALFVPDWMIFSTELDSMRGAWLDSQRQPAGTAKADPYSNFSSPRK